MDVTFNDMLKLQSQLQEGWSVLFGVYVPDDYVDWLFGFTNTDTLTEVNSCLMINDNKMINLDTVDVISINNKGGSSL